MYIDLTSLDAMKCSNSFIQGYVLEASPLQKLPVRGLEGVQGHCAAFNVLLDHQSREDQAINGTDSNIKYKTGFSRYPLVLFLDGIVSSLNRSPSASLPQLN